jgi:uncharacterized protein YkwD
VPAAATRPPPRPRRWSVYTVLSFLLGISSLPAAILLANQLLAVPLTVLGILLGLIGLLGALSRRGAGFGLALVSTVVCGSSFFVAFSLAGRVDGITRTVREYFNGTQTPSPTSTAEANRPDPKETAALVESAHSQKPSTPAKPPERTTAEENSDGKDGSNTTEDTGNETQDREARKVLKKLNDYRKMADLKPVTLDAKYHKGCAAHAAYLVKNYDTTGKRTMDLHEEDPDRPGYSEEGRKAAKASVIALSFGAPSSPDRSLDLWIGSFFHRIPLLDPRLKTIGFAHARGPNYLCVSVLETHPEGDGDQIVIYPSPLQEDVPLNFSGPEVPDPIPESKEKKAGYPVTVTFPEARKVTQVKAAMIEVDSGKEVKAWVSTPEQLAYKKIYQQNTICLIPKSPLASRTTYSVKVVAMVDDKEWVKTWIFTTGRAQAAESQD